MLTVMCQKRRIILSRVVHAGSQPVSFTPPVSLSLSRHAELMLRWREPGSAVDANVQSQVDTSTTPVVKLAIPDGWKLLNTYPLKDGTASFLVDAPEGPNRLSGTVSASVTFPGGASYTEGYRAIGYPGLTTTNIYIPAKELLIPADIRLPHGYPRIGYLRGTGDSVPEAIESLGQNAPTILTVADLTLDHLKQFDTVILGVRTYSAHPDLHGAPTQALLDYARNGGNVVVQYQTTEFTSEDAPYPSAPTKK